MNSKNLSLNINILQSSSIPQHDQGVWYSHDWLWAMINAMFTLCLVIATSLLARYTWRLVKETHQEISAQEKRHMDSLLPHIALLVRYIQRGKKGSADFYIAHQLIAKNIGPGFAQNIIIATPSIDVVGNYRVNCPTALSSGDRFIIAEQPFHPQGPHLENISVKYFDAYGREFESFIEGKVYAGIAYSWREISAPSPSRTA